MDGRVITELDARGVATITIDRPARLNALSRALMTEFIAALNSLAGEPRLRVAVLAGAGGKAFVGGADIGEMAALDADSARAFITLVHGTCAAVRKFPVPVIGRIDGYALGAGLELAAACDLRIASPQAMFAMPEVRLGIPSVVEAALLPRLIGASRARMLVYTGRSIDAATAHSWGLVDEVAPDLDVTVGRYVAEMLEAGPNALRDQKSLAKMWEELPLAEAIERSIGVFASSWRSDEPQLLMKGYLQARQRAKAR